MTAFAELHCLSNFTFLRGASHAGELVERAAKLGYRALAITDECSLAGIVRAHEAAKEHGLHLIVGIEIHLEDGPSLVLLAMNREGYGNLSALVTTARRRTGKGSYRLTRRDLDNGVPACMALWIRSFRPRMPAAGEGKTERTVTGDSHRLAAMAGPPPASPACAPSSLLDTARWLRARFGDRLWLAAELHQGPDDAAHLTHLRALSAAAAIPVVAANDVHMHARQRRALQDVMTAIRLGTPVATAGTALHPNAERHLRPLETLAGLYPGEWLEASVAIADRCTFSLDELRYEYPEELSPPGETPTTWLRKLTRIGLAWRYEGGPPPWERLDGDGPPSAGSPGPAHGDSSLESPAFPGSDPAAGLKPAGAAREPAVRSMAAAHSLAFHPSPAKGTGVPRSVHAQVEHELALIAELRYEPYFLTVFDIVRFARRRHILCQGRGSAANSAVCFALGITEVDPARMSTLFERFISRERNEPPDIDVDFEHQRREEVIQYLYAKYTRERAAIAATVICYRPKSAFRDVGKALGLDLAQVDRIAKNLAFWDRGTEVIAERLRETGFDPRSLRMRQLVALTRTLIGFPRHLSQHVGGFVISRGPLSRLVPVENAAMPDRSIIQWDKDDLDALGLLKVDVLALGMLSAIRRALDMVSVLRGRPFGMHDIPAEDPAVYGMLCKADSVGVFQVESRAQMGMLPRLKPRCFYDLVIEVAIVRPGPIQGGMVHPYLRRRQKLEPVTYPSPEVRSVLERTLGVPIFQEQVMQLAVVAAGFSPGEADRLRRSMAAWRRKGGLTHFQDRLVEGMRSRGYSEQFAQQIYQQILGFGEYGFPESHSASFALLVYVSAWLKHHEPAAFCAALLNSQPMGFYAPSQLVQDAQRHGVEVLPVDVLESEWDCVLKDRRWATGDAQWESPGISAHGSGAPHPPPVLPPEGEGTCCSGGRDEAPGNAPDGLWAGGEKQQESRGTAAPGSGAPHPHPVLPPEGEGTCCCESHAGKQGRVGDPSGAKHSNFPSPSDRGPRKVEDFSGWSRGAGVRVGDPNGAKHTNLPSPSDRGPRKVEDFSGWSRGAGVRVGFPSGAKPMNVPSPALRLGLRMIKGLSQAAAERIVEARRTPFESFEQLALRAGLNRHELECLAHAGALASVSGHRREALWEIAGIESRPPILRDTVIRDATPELPWPTEGEEIVADYSSLGLTLGRHPLALLRAHLKKRRMFTAQQLMHARHGQLVRSAGLVTCRQRPGTASGVIFVTLEDETGSTNVVVWHDLAERQRRALLGSKLLAVHGTLERDGSVAHLIAGKLEDLSHLLGHLATQSRDFH